jgi:Flp pilus assembly protein TadG
MSWLMRRTRKRERGQSLALMVLALIPALAMVALIVDGGHAWVEQRSTQTGADAMSEAGATVLSEKLTGQGTPAGGWDSAVVTAVIRLADANGTTLSAAYYTDVCGTVLTLTNHAAQSDYSDAARVGSSGDTFLGQTGIARDSACTPVATGAPAGTAQGVRALGTTTFATFVAGVIGVTQLTASADATAVTGFLQSGCAADTGAYCVVLPIAVWYNHYHCDEQNGFVDDGTPWQLDDGTQNADLKSIIPLCKTGAGDVGWIQWPDNPNSGMSGVCSSIQSPDNPGVNLLPYGYWLQAAQAGNSGTPCVEDAINDYSGHTILLPIYDLPCTGTVDPNPSTSSLPYNCVSPDDPVSRGSQGWFHTTQFAAFFVEQAYLNGGSAPECEQGNGATNCLTGWFEGYITGGNVAGGSNGGSGAVVGIQLVE